jgi:alkylation response protein AidB-like acyl-CoA dehydrogenase
MSVSMQDIGRIGFSEEQAEILEAAAVFCREKSPIATVRQLILDDLGHDPDVWREIGDLGWLGIAIPEPYGGLGLPLGAVVPMVEQMGRYLLAGPFASTTLAAQAVLVGGTEAQKQALLPKLAAGTAATLALVEASGDWNLANIQASAVDAGDDRLHLAGGKILVCDAAVAEWIIASVLYEGRPALVVIDRGSFPKGAIRGETIVDETRRAFAVSLDGVEASKRNLLVGQAATLDHIHLAANLLAVAEMCGGTQAVIDYTVDYLNTRKQFGRLIGSYQALKHPIVDAYVGYEQARSHLYSAAHCFDEQGTGEIATRMAKVQADAVFSYAADRAIQFHGGFGFTYDCDAQLYRRRAIWHASQYGDGLYHKRRLAELLL